MDLGLKGKRALVTGSTAGIGLATARALASEGAQVTVNGRMEARVGRAVDRLKSELCDRRWDRGGSKQRRRLPDADRPPAGCRCARQQSRHLRAEAVRGDSG